MFFFLFKHYLNSFFGLVVFVPSPFVFLQQNILTLLPWTQIFRLPLLQRNWMAHVVMFQHTKVSVLTKMLTMCCVRLYNIFDEPLQHWTIHWTDMIFNSFPVQLGEPISRTQFETVVKHQHIKMMHDSYWVWAIKVFFCSPHHIQWFNKNWFSACPNYAFQKTGSPVARLYVGPYWISGRLI